MFLLVEEMMYNLSCLLIDVLYLNSLFMWFMFIGLIKVYLWEVDILVKCFLFYIVCRFVNRYLIKGWFIFIIFLFKC